MDYQVHIILMVSFTILHLGTQSVTANRIKVAYVANHPDGETPSVQIEEIESIDDYNYTSIPHNYIASAVFDNSINSTGWAYLEVKTNDQDQDPKQAYYAGYLEGYLTGPIIYMHWYNSLHDFCEQRVSMCSQIQQYVDTNTAWVKKMIVENAAAQPYWHQVDLVYSQLKGLHDGYLASNITEGQALTYNDIVWLNIQGDLEDLQEVFAPSSVESMSRVNGNKMRGSGSCSALIKLLPDGSDLYVAHDTWSSFQSMLRVQKKYVLPYKTVATSQDVVPGRSMTFSSYPGTLTSGDDFYLISSGLVTLETTIGNSNKTRWSNVQPTGQVLETVRSVVANRLGHCGKSWSKTFSEYNSGTYNNQWMVVDYKRFKPGTNQTHLKSKLLWVLEQIPGFVISSDRTQVLREQSYWPSYNSPSFAQVFNLSGNQLLVDRYGDWFTYDRTPRALMFRRDHVKVRDTATMMALMRYNNFTHDPLSRCNCTPPFSGENAIAARNDLNPANGTYPFGALGHRSHAATDAKITTSGLFMNLQFIGVSGPVHNGNLPSFRWSTSDYSGTAHLGHPDLWMFEPVTHKWILK